MKKRILHCVLALASAALIGCGVNEPAPSSGGGGGVGAGATCSSGNLYTFKNNLTYPVWLGEAYQGGGSLSANIIAPPGGDWMMAPGSTVSLCMPAGWSGRFWPRTECDFTSLFSNDPGYKSCASSSQCSSGHTCFGGKCLLNCSQNNGPPNTQFCQSAQGLNNPKAVCYVAGAAQVCSYQPDTVCRTGDCGGLYQCYGQWDNNQARAGAAGPVTLFEPTGNMPPSIVNYDVSLVSGYNVPMQVTPSMSPSPQLPANCYAPGCTSDLNESCPANLQVKETPTNTPGPIACGNGFCQSGVCKNNTCIVACNDPSDQCTTPNPPAGLMCNAVVPSGDGSTYADMYFLKNFSGKVHFPPGADLGATMVSGNQGTPTCWSTIDCLPEQTCKMNFVTNFPAGTGVCVPNNQALEPQINCATQSDVGKPCGGYAHNFPNAIGYTCVSFGSANNDVACLPPYHPPIVGLGQYVTGTVDTTVHFWSGSGSLVNPEWQTAAKQAGNGTPWYEYFSKACPNTYGWQYDDYAGGFACNTSPTGGMGPNVNITIIFGPASPMAEAQPNRVFRMRPLALEFQDSFQWNGGTGQLGPTAISNK
jgi:Thaumatin family